jgi:hypothetical protein
VKDPGTAHFFASQRCYVSSCISLSQIGCTARKTLEPSNWVRVAHFQNECEATTTANMCLMNEFQAVTTATM